MTITPTYSKCYLAWISIANLRAYDSTKMVNINLLEVKAEINYVHCNPAELDPSEPVFQIKYANAILHKIKCFTTSYVARLVLKYKKLYIHCV